MINGYKTKNLTGKVAHYKQGQVLSVKQIVKHNLTTRFVLNNSQYITANKHYSKATHQTFKVLGWDYSWKNDYSRGSALRYRVAGGYISANSKLVK